MSAFEKKVIKKYFDIAEDIHTIITDEDVKLAHNMKVEDIHTYLDDYITDNITEICEYIAEKYTKDFNL